MKHFNLLFVLVCLTSPALGQILGDPIVHWDFADGIPADFINTGPGPDAKWEYRGPDTTPDNTVGSLGSCAGDGDPIFSASQDNGFVMFDSAFWDDNDGTCDGLGGAYEGPHEAILETPAIDLSLSESAILTFQQFVRHYQCTTTVSMSVDGGLSWIELHDNGGWYILGDNAEWITYNITEAAVGQSDVRFRFRFFGDHYWWCLDDIAVYAPNDNDIQLLTANYAPVDPADPAGNGDIEYTVYPEVMLNPLEIHSRARNIGGLEQTGVTLNVEVTRDGATVLSSSDGPADLAASQAQNFNLSPWTPPGSGDYEISYDFTQNELDENPDNNSALRTFKVRPNEYARDEGVSAGQYLGTALYEEEEFFMGNLFLTRESDLMISSIGFALGDSTTVGTTVTGRLVSRDSVNVILAETEPYVVNAWDLNPEGGEKFVWLNFAEPVVSTAFTLYFAVVHHPGGVGERARIAQSGFPPVETTILSYPATSSLFYMPTTPMVRLGLFEAGQTPGCTDATAANYDEMADVDNGSCRFEGCTISTAANYDPGANFDDDSCEFTGCTDPSAENYDPEANVDDGSCIVNGCTDAEACNYDPLATADDASCTFPEAFEDCEGNCLNDEDGNGICDELEPPCPGQGCCGPGTLWDPIAEYCFPADDCPADISGDGIVDAFDIILLLQDYGTACSD